MKPSDIRVAPNYYDRYVHLIADINLDDAFADSLAELEQFDWVAAETLADATYAPGKWTIRDIVQHLIDWEWIMTYRAMLYLRDTGLAPQGFEPDDLARSAAAGSPKTLAQLRAEITALRHATRSFFAHLALADFHKKGPCWDCEISVLSVGFIILGHQRHHFGIICRQYLPLLSPNSASSYAIGRLILSSNFCEAFMISALCQFPSIFTMRIS